MRSREERATRTRGGRAAGAKTAAVADSVGSTRGPGDTTSERGPGDATSERGPVDATSERGPVDTTSERRPVDTTPEWGPEDTSISVTFFLWRLRRGREAGEATGAH